MRSTTSKRCFSSFIFCSTIEANCLSILLINIGCYFLAKGKSMTNEVRAKCRYVYGVGADALYQTNMIECHRAFQISW